eukprot:CAMPEP_0201898046 /NCGR_PEP_ID=MMETSP0902-20130614/47775_1 /ASSEMBLY_ACC=CAM_ASM_000551 /TAXON_ID=420261 /ORGANISM="Thalassiosira antarctica, Strain CCMP982" /LENGTH=103 /DNA_ID=CAMNT_0048431083 /DNA_START=148 /DNA_END=459 /DNA_ORIENTATION=-
MTFTLFDSEIDFTFAICPKRQQCIERTNFYHEYNGCDSEYASEDTSSVDSCRSVTFADNVVSEIISVPRYEKESISELFYNRLDMMRFRQEARLERMQVQVIW